MRIARYTLLVLAMPCAVASGGFLPPEAVTDGDGLDQLSRNPVHAAAFDSDGRMQLAYWRGGSVTTVAEPSFVLHRDWSPTGGWTSEAVVDQSFIGSDRVGGRQPSLAIDTRGDLWIAWHDHRHSTPANGYIDNLEIYADRRPAGGAFSESDQRLTTTTAGGVGDNGYLPIIAAHADGRLSVAWYDFTAAATVSDIYLKTSGTDGAFDLGEPMASLRVTNKDDRGGSPAFTVVDMAVDAVGVRHLVWATGTSATGSDLYYASVPTGSVVATPVLLSTGTSSYFDTPRVAVAPSGDVWAYWSDTSAPSERRIRLRRRPAGEPAFEAAITPEPAGGSQLQPVVSFAGTGDLHLAWIDEGQNRVVYRHYPAPAGAAEGSHTLAVGTGTLQRVAMVLDGDGGPHLVVEERLGFTAHRLWHVRPVGAPMEAASWNLYR